MRASALAVGRSARGAGRTPARVLPATAALGRLLFLSRCLGLKHVAVLAQPLGLKECGLHPPLADGGGPRGHRLPSRHPSRSLRAVGTCGRFSALPCIRQGLLLFSKCISCPEPQPAPPLPSGLSLRALHAGGGRGSQVQLLPLTGRRQVASALCCERDAGLRPGS